MNKKRIGVAIALVLSLSLFTITALASGNNLEGYGLLKEVLQNPQEMTGGSFDYSISVVDNNEVVFESVGSGVGNTQDEASLSGSISDGSLTKHFELSKVGDIVIFKDVANNLYYQMDETDFEDYKENHHDRFDDYDGDFERKMTASEERLLDALVGDMKNKVSLTTLAEGNKEISFELKEDDIPLAVNLMLNIASENSKAYDHEQREVSLDDISGIFPFIEGFDTEKQGYEALVSDLKLLSFKLDMTVNSENQMSGLGFFVEVEGKDEQGVYHVLSIDTTLAYTAQNHMTVTPIDIDGELIIIDQELVELWKNQ